LGKEEEEAYLFLTPATKKSQKGVGVPTSSEDFLDLKGGGGGEAWS